MVCRTHSVHFWAAHTKSVKWLSRTLCFSVSRLKDLAGSPPHTGGAPFRTRKVFFLHKPAQQEDIHLAWACLTLARFNSDVRHCIFNSNLLVKMSPICDLTCAFPIKSKQHMTDMMTFALHQHNRYLHHSPIALLSIRLSRFSSREPTNDQINYMFKDTSA